VLLAALGVHGCSAVTAITAQNTTSVTHISPVAPEIVEAQIVAVMKDIEVHAAKTGMLFSEEIIRTVVKHFSENRVPLVVDPVMVSKSGALLLEEKTIQTLMTELLPVATIVTPNAAEAEKLTGITIKNPKDATVAAKKIAEMGPRAVVVKGGHIDTGEFTRDILFFRGRVVAFENKRINTKSTHGTGCTFSAAIAAELAKGKEIKEAVELANKFVNAAIKNGLNVGKGFGPVNPTGDLHRSAEKFRVLENIAEATKMLESSTEFARLIPEVQSNLAMALPGAVTKEDVAAIPGRIVKAADRVRASSCPMFGASQHLANTILAAMQFDSKFRAALNIRFAPEILACCRSLGFSCSSYDRRREPKHI
jgi:hydroxymethylpyrimidine/phosphomethylpyrimidine kinase